MRFQTMVVSALVTLLLLFGGFYVYQSFYIKGAIEEEISTKPQLTIEKLEIDREKVRIDLKAGDNFSVNSDYYPLTQALQPYLGERKLVLHLDDHPNETLIEIWDELNFSVREGIEQQKYTKVLETIKELSKENKVKYQATIDEHNLYIVLRDEEYFLTRVIPLESETTALNKTSSEVKNSE